MKQLLKWIIPNGLMLGVVILAIQGNVYANNIMCFFYVFYSILCFLYFVNGKKIEEGRNYSSPLGVPQWLDVAYDVTIMALLASQRWYWLATAQVLLLSATAYKYDLYEKHNITSSIAKEYCCDECKKPIYARQYEEGQGLCETCIGKIN